MAQMAWRSLPRGVREGVGPRLAFASHRFALGGGGNATKHPIDPGPLIVSHYGDSAFGLARGGRLTAAALRELGFDPIEHDIRAALEDGRVEKGALSPERRGGVWISHCNPEHIAPVLRHIDPADWQGRYRIGYWAWELPRAPRAWLWMSRFFHEVWAASEFVAQSLAGAETLVRVMPYPVRLAPIGTRKPGPLSILTMADLRSALARKNPLGAIEAFRRAMPAPQPERVRLRVKLNGLSFDENALAQVRAATDRPDIELIERVLSDAEMEDLLSSADLLVSLHRAEGFGLPIAEAMARGVPALATGWSGNVDFMGGLDALNVRYSMIPVDDPSGVYLHKQQWADPDLDDAAQKLRRLIDDDALRARLGAEARQRIADLHKPWTDDAPTTQPWRSLVH